MSFHENSQAVKLCTNFAGAEWNDGNLNVCMSAGTTLVNFRLEIMSRKIMLCN